MDQKGDRFVIVLFPDELEVPKVGFNEEVRIKIEEPTVEQPVHQYVARFSSPSRMAFEFGGIPALSVCFLFKYANVYSLFTVDVYNMMVYIFICRLFRQTRIIRQLPSDGHVGANPYFVIIGYIQFILAGVCFAYFKLITSSICFYQFIVIQIALYTQKVEELT